MLVEFSVSNFKSFKEVATLSMIPTSGKELPGNLAGVELAGLRKNKFSLSKMAAIYGANASGKSNLIKAIAVARNFILKSANVVDNDDNSKLPFVPFRLDVDCADSPSIFEFVFVIDDTIYRYGFSADEKQIHKEWLSYRNSINGREYALLNREDLTFDYKRKALGISIGPKSLFMSVATIANDECCVKISSFFKNIIFYFPASGSQIFTTVIDFIKGGDDEVVNELLSFADIGIHGFRIEEIPIDTLRNDLANAKVKIGDRDIPKDTSEIVEASRKLMLQFIDEGLFPTHEVKFSHAVYRKGLQIDKIDFDLSTESLGTLKFVSLISLAIKAIRNNSILIADEVDTSIHPILAKYFMKFFNSISENSAQVIFATHNLALFDEEVLRRDQIWITEKDNIGSTKLLCVSDYKPRTDAVLSKKYVEGRFGGIPNLHFGYFDSAINTIKRKVIDKR